MKSTQRSKIGFHVAEAVYSVIVILWYLLPFYNPSLGGFNPLSLANTLFGTASSLKGPWLLVTALVYAVPVICIWKIASIFLARTVPVAADPDRPVPIILNLISSGIVVALVVLHLLNQAHNARYFAAFPPITYAVAGISVGYNGFFMIMLIASNSRRREAYREYLEFRRTSAEGRSFSGALQRRGIQRKLLMRFVPLILVIIFVLSFTLLQDFRGTIITAVNANGQSLAERVANSVKSNPGDSIYLEDLFAGEAKKNSAAAGQASPYRFNALSYYRRDVKNGGFLIEASSNRQLINGRETKDILLTETVRRDNDVTESYEFLAPVTLSNKFLGYVMADYARDVIYEPYFRTQVKVFVIAALFMYASIFLIYLFGREIVFPILFLRMSVNSIAEKLSSMTKGKLRFSSELLQYNDRVTTRDEIKGLSEEVNHMTTVIREVIPYVSQATLKAAAQEAPTSKNRDLACLFTDIRGFTEMSESMTPDKVVAMLNHYLEIESSIIHANEGDVDKFIGDAMFARFDGRRKEFNACKAGLEIRRAMSEEARKARATDQRQIDVGIGINAGEVTFGSVGAQDRKDFTAIGDNVNVASRLEGLNKQYHVKSLISHSVYEKVKDEFLCREIDLVAVKGKSEALRVFEIIREKSSATDRDERFKKLFETSLALYRRQRWDSAEQGFTASAKEFNDKTSRIFLERIKMLRKNPPPRDWDGEYRMTMK